MNVRLPLRFNESDSFTRVWPSLSLSLKYIFLKLSLRCTIWYKWIFYRYFYISHFVLALIRRKTHCAHFYLWTTIVSRLRSTHTLCNFTRSTKPCVKSQCYLTSCTRTHWRSFIWNDSKKLMPRYVSCCQYFDYCTVFFSEKHFLSQY